MKIGGGVLIAVALIGLWSITVEFALSLIQAHGRFVFNSPDLFAVCGYYAICILMLTLGVIMWRRKPKNGLW
jgi:hypothetical protein